MNNSKNKHTRGGVDSENTAELPPLQQPISPPSLDKLVRELATEQSPAPPTRIQSSPIIPEQLPIPTQNSSQPVSNLFTQSKPQSTVDLLASPSIIQGQPTQQPIQTVSATSEPNEGIRQELTQINIIPQDARPFVTGIMYHVVFDCDVSKFFDNKSRKEHQGTIFGKIARVESDRFPIVYSREDALRIAGRLVSMAVSKGSVGVGINKKYPFLGAVIIGFQFKDLENVTYVRGSTVSLDEKIEEIKKLEEELEKHKQDFSGLKEEKEKIIHRIEMQIAELKQTGGQPNYSNIMKNDKDLVFYEVIKNEKSFYRGTLSRNSLENTNIVNAEYVVRTDIQPANGFALLNLVPTLSVHDIDTLKCLYNGKILPCYEKKDEEQITLQQRGQILLGGRYTNIITLAAREKAKYLAYKNSSKTGGNIATANSDEQNWKQLAKQKKAEYIRLKQQLKGGSLDNSDTKWKHLYHQQ